MSDMVVACLHFAKIDGEYRLSVVDLKTHEPIKLVLSFGQVVLLAEQTNAEVLRKARE